MAPITSTVRGMKLEIPLPSELKTQGTVLIHQIKSLDYANRKIGLIEKCSEDTIQRVTELATIIIQ